MLLKALWSDVRARVKMPTKEKVEELIAITHARHENLKDIYCVADGLKLTFESCDGLDEQSMFYYGWTHDHYIAYQFVCLLRGWTDDKKSCWNFCP